jgi:hypothetical protein
MHTPLIWKPCLTKQSENSDMPNVEICRVVLCWDLEQQANRWWEARLVTPEGERVIHRLDFWDDSYRSDAKHLWVSVLRDLSPFAENPDERHRKSEELHDSTHARLVAHLLGNGWEPAGNDAHGRINLMKRQNE